jgi:hypothetical protein
MEKMLHAQPRFPLRDKTAICWSRLKIATDVVGNIEPQVVRARESNAPPSSS